MIYCIYYFFYYYQQAAIAIDFYSFICKTDERNKKKFLLTLCALFNLLQSSEKLSNNGSLEGIDALVGCGLVLFDGTDDFEVNII